MARQINDADRAELQEFISKTEASIECYEDILDAQEIADGIEDARKNGTIPWEQVKAELGL